MRRRKLRRAENFCSYFGIRRILALFCEKWFCCIRKWRMLFLLPFASALEVSPLPLSPSAFGRGGELDFCCALALLILLHRYFSPFPRFQKCIIFPVASFKEREKRMKDEVFSTLPLCICRSGANSIFYQSKVFPRCY